MIKIRKYEKEDKERVIKLVRKVLFEIFNTEAENIEDLENIEQEYFENNGVFYVVEDNGKIIGTIAVKKEEDNIARIKRMFIDKEYRKQGIGQRLLDRIIEFCKNKGYKKIILSTHQQMQEAIEFYKKNEFKEYKRDKEIFFERII